MRNIIVGALLFLGACAQTPVDVRQEHLLACEAYTSALERVVLWRDLGRIGDEDWARVQRLEATTTPVCMTDAPSVEGLAVLNTSLDALEALLAELVIEGSA